MEGRPSDAGDADLVRQAKAGDVAAYARLLRNHEPAARRLAYVLCGDDGDDATQEAYVKAWVSLPSHREGSSFAGWLLRIVSNEARNRIRAGGRRRRHELRLSEDRTSREAAPSPEVAVLASERRLALLEAVNALPEPMRDVVTLRHLAGLTEAETASALSVPLGTVKSRLARGLDRLRVTERCAQHE